MTARRLGFLALLTIAVGYLATGVVVIAPGEMGVVRRFGRTLSPAWGPGLHLGGPIGVDRLTRVRTDEVRRLDVGLAGTPGASDEAGAGEFLTGDLNFLRAQATLQYRVADASTFALQAERVEPLLRRLTEASLSRAFARLGIDSAIRERRAVAADEARQEIARRADGYGLGVDVLSLSLTDVRPPTEVAPDFAAAQSAQSDHDRRLTEARTYAATTATQTESEIRTRVERARGKAERLLALARSRVSRFVALQAEAARSRPLTIRRLYYEALRETLPRIRRKVLLTPDEGVDLSILGVE